MRHSNTAAFASRRHIATHGAATGMLAMPATDSSGSWIRLRMAVTPTQVFALRQLLHKAIGSLARIYVVEVDHRNGQATVHVQVGRDGREAAMRAIVMALPAADFGAGTA